jgi:hypothetical protein
VDKAIAIANNDTVFLSWIYDQKIPDCLGFAVYRVDAVGRTALPAWVGFKGGSNPSWQHKDTRNSTGGILPQYAGRPIHTHCPDDRVSEQIAARRSENAHNRIRDTYSRARLLLGLFYERDSGDPGADAHCS